MKIRTILMSFVIIGCSQGTFQASTAGTEKKESKQILNKEQDSKKQPTENNVVKVSEKAETSSENEANQNSEESTIVQEQSDSDQIPEKSEASNSIESCLSTWGKTPLSAQSIQNYRIIDFSNSGINQSQYEDNHKTDFSELILVKLNSSGILSMTLRLMNPNGWYCIENANSGINQTTIIHHCKAAVAKAVSHNSGIDQSQIQKEECPN